MPSPYGLLGQQGWQGLLGKTGSFLGNNSNMLMTMGTDLLNYSRSPVGPIFNQQALAYGMKGDQEKRQQKKTQKFLMDKFGMSPQEAEAGAGDKDLLNFLLASPQDDRTAAQKDYEYGLKHPGFADRTAGDERYGLNPIYAEDAEGNTVLMQPSNQGGVRPIDMPDGITPSTGTEKVDLGTNWGILNKRTGEMITTYPKDVAGAAAQQEIGEAAGTAAAGIPKVVQAAATMKAMIEDVKNDPNREWGTGWRSMFPKPAGGAAYSFQKKSDQLRGQAFVQAFETLKGGGAISEAEGQAGTDAITRLDTALNDAEYLDALNDLMAIVEKAEAWAKFKAGQGAQPTDQNSDPLGIR